MMEANVAAEGRVEYLEDSWKINNLWQGTQDQHVIFTQWSSAATLSPLVDKSAMLAFSHDSVRLLERGECSIAGVNEAEYFQNFSVHVGNIVHHTNWRLIFPATFPLIHVHSLEPMQYQQYIHGSTF